VKEAPIPENEQQRIASLVNLAILDTPAEERFDRITRLARRALNVPIALVSLVDSERQWFKSNQGMEGICETSRALSICGHAIMQDGLFLVPDISKDRRFFDNPMWQGDPGIRFYAGYAIHSPDGARVGTLCTIDHSPRDLCDDERLALQDLAELVEAELKADALSKTERELRQALSIAERQASVDGLTRLWNRSAIRELLSRELERCRRSSLPLSVVLADIDHFKLVNDTHGHNVGDEVLAILADAFRASFRSYDMLGRSGGEEFMAVLTECGPNEAEAVANRMVDLVRKWPFKTSVGEIRITISAGVSFGMGECGLPNNIDAIIEAADKAMYKAKHNGRDRVEIAPFTGSNGTV
jgi:diguanylate cyclase (GGDEF)-like protein